MMDQTLELRLKKLMLFRLVMVTTLLLIAAYVGAVSETLLAVNPLYFLIGATYFLTVFHPLALPFLPAQAILYSIFVTGVACATVAMIGGFLSEGLRHVGERLEEAVEQVADLRELNEVIVNSIQSGLLTTDTAGHILYVNRFGESILERPASAVRGRSIRDVFGSSLEPVALRAVAGSRHPARLGAEDRRPGGAPRV